MAIVKRWFSNVINVIFDVLEALIVLSIILFVLFAGLWYWVFECVMF